MVTITDVLPRSRADKAGLMAGDVLVSINKNIINDVLDYRFYLANKSITLVILRDGKQKKVKIKKQEYDDIGLDFETPLMDKKHSCENKCVFCFIDQLPKGMRSSLYFKDDDSRLSFLHGNYITLTNLHDEDIDRIINMHISPVNVSVHTTNPELRVKMMKNKRSGEVLSYLNKLADAGINLCCQIVLCKGINDGAELDRTMCDLEALAPAMQSTSIVPAGLTKFRDGLYELEAFTPEECAAVIKQVTEFGDMCKVKHGTRLFYPADELYIKAGLPLPEDDFYEDYSQIQNGVGMLTDMRVCVAAELEDEEFYEPYGAITRTVSVATGHAAEEHMRSVAKAIQKKFSGISINVYAIENDFFGERITVSGLLTGKDIIEQLKGKELGDELLIPATCLRAEGDVLLDDVSPEDISKALGVSVRAADSDAKAFIAAVLGI
ncbi:MAG: DUF512 domain-containing protein [Ruminococcaceae bacterium]|nr:DUF512 domain-containing protein [Oscillospiraceae bacterium]